MDKFIEVTTESGEDVLINTAFIVSIQDNVIEMSLLGDVQSRYIHTVDSYAKLKKKVEEVRNV